MTTHSANLVDNTLQLEASVRAEFDRALEELDVDRPKWAGLAPRGRIELLAEMLGCIREVAPQWVRSGNEAKRISPDSNAAGEEWLTGPYLVARNIRLLKRSLEDIERFGHPQLYRPAFSKQGRTIAPVFPTDWFDGVMFMGYRAEVWLPPGVRPEKLADHMAVAYRKGGGRSAVCAVLGAGNVSSIGPMDALYKLFVENSVVCLKIHPQNGYLRESWERSLKPLIDFGVLRIVSGGAAEGHYLVHHRLVDEVHLTGSLATYDAIVFGEGADGAERKRQRRPVLQKRVTSELGNVSAMIVVPGEWRKRDLARQAENVASSLVNNAGFNCNATRVLVTHRSWVQRSEFLDAIRDILKRIPTRLAYYGGAAERYERFSLAYPQMEKLRSPASPSDLPWGFIPDVDASANPTCFQEEPFCGLMCETKLDASDPAAFLDQAVQLVNERIFGTLNASILVSPESQREPAIRQAFDRALSDLQVGTIAVNHWAAVGFALCSTTWGAFPTPPNQEIESGQDVVHNTYMFDSPEKSVIYGPFRPWPKPVWFATHRRAGKLGPLLLDFECQPSLLKLPQIFRYACEL